MFSWEEYGLKLHVSRMSTASFKVRVVNPRTFELPEGTELLSPFYWVTSEGDTELVGILYVKSKLILIIQYRDK